MMARLEQDTRLRLRKDLNKLNDLTWSPALCDIDPVVTMLLLVILMMEPGSLLLQDRAKVQKIQEHHAWMLQKYLNMFHEARDNSSSAQFHSLLMARDLVPVIARAKAKERVPG